MLQAATLKFLKDLKKNNNKPWFDSHRKDYEAAKKDFADHVQLMINGIARFDEPIGLLLPKNCTFRINRDVRFSKDKSPYKPNMGASMNHGGKKIMNAGYYFHLEPGGKSFAAGGIYMPMPPDLAKLRQEIDYNFKDWKSLVENAKFKKIFPDGVNGVEILQRPPKGYDESNPAIHYLKMKSFIVSHTIDDKLLTDKKLLSEVGKTFEAMKGMIKFLNGAMADV